MAGSQETSWSQGLGWFLRRTSDPLALATFYEQALGLPRLRHWDVPETTGSMLWCGDVGVLELNRLNAKVRLAPERSLATPIFCSSDLAVSVERALGHGARQTGEVASERATCVSFLDPHGFTFGIEEIRQPAYPGDVFLLDEIAAGRTALPGDIRIDGAIWGVSRILHAATNVAAEVQFLTSIGFAGVGEASATIGGGTTIEVVEAERPFVQPTERDMAHDTWIARIYGLGAMRDNLASSSGKLLSQHEFKGGTLDYALTPANVLIGWQERKRYDPDLPTTQMVEDLAARSRWIERDA